MPCSSSLISLCVSKEDYELRGFFFLLLLLNQQNPILQSCSEGFRSGQTKVPLGFKLPRKRIKRWFGSTAFKTGYLEIQDQQVTLEIGSQQRTLECGRRGEWLRWRRLWTSEQWLIRWCQGTHKTWELFVCFISFSWSIMQGVRLGFFKCRSFIFCCFLLYPSLRVFFLIVLPLYERLKSSLKQISDTFTPCQNYLLKTSGFEKENHSIKVRRTWSRKAGLSGENTG